MEENKEYSLSDIARTIKSFSRYLLKRKWWLTLFIVAGASSSLVYYYHQKPKYQAITTFILEEKSAGGGGLAGLASQFGVNLGSLSGGGSLFAGDNILNILKSRNVVQKVLLSRVDDMPSSNTLADLYLESTGIKDKWHENPFLNDFNFTKVNGSLSPTQDSILNDIYETVIKKNLLLERTSKLGSIIKVQVTAGNIQFARLLSIGLVEEASKLYYEIKTSTAESNITQLQRRADSLLVLLNRKSFTAAASQPLDINPALRTAVVPAEIATRDKTVLTTLYAEVAKNLEASKLLLSQQTPIIQILDQPQYLLDDNKKSMSFLLIVFSVVAGLLFTLGLFLIFWIKTGTQYP